MARAKVTYVPDRQAYVALNQPSGMVDEGVGKAAGWVRDRAKMNLTAAGRIDTGALRQSIVSERYRNSTSRVTYLVGSELEYARWQEEGVRGPIYPRRARVLRFKPKGSSAFIFRPKVSGFSGAHYLRDALNELNMNDFI